MSYWCRIRLESVHLLKSVPVYKILSSSIPCCWFWFTPTYISLRLLPTRLLLYHVSCGLPLFFFVCIFACHTCLTSLLLFIIFKWPHQLNCLHSVKPKIDIMSNSALSCSFVILFLLVTPNTLLRYFISVTSILLFCLFGNTHDSHPYFRTGLYIAFYIFIFVFLHICFSLINL